MEDTVREVSDQADNRSEISNYSIQMEQRSGVPTYTLVQVIENFALLGLLSWDKWEKALIHMKSHPDTKNNGEMFNLFIVLNQIIQSVFNKIYMQVNSQDKLPSILANTMTFSEFMQHLKPTLRKQLWKDRSFSTICVNSALLMMRDIVAKLDNSTEQIENEQLTVNDKDGEKIKKRLSRPKSRKNKKQRRATSSSSSSSSSSSASSSSSCSDSGDDKYDKLFKIKGKRTPSIKQVFQTRRNKRRRKMVTPGEHGRIMIKIEITDVRDLKNCSPKTYWTKVSKKALFLTDENDQIFKNIDEVMFTVGERIKSTKGMDVEDVVLDKY